ncbi:MAG: hypothetical protein ACI8WT_004011 [Clostridium sp.]|jgi:hypothetical protein
MKIKKKYLKLLFTYVVILIIIICLVIMKQQKHYDKLIIIDDRKKVIENVDNSIPIRIQFYNKKWGEGETKDSKTIRELWSFINSIPKSNKGNDKVVNQYTDEEIIGTIYYLNGKKDDLYIGNIIKINNYVYGNVNLKSEISYFRNKFNEELCTSSNISAFINEKNKIVIINENNDSKKLGNAEKVKLKMLIEKSTKIIKTNSLTEYINKKGMICYHIKIYVDQENNDGLITRSNATNIINIDIYENKYFIVTDLQNESGDLIHMVGELKEFCDKVYN